MEAIPKPKSGVTERLKRDIFFALADKRKFQRRAGSSPDRAVQRLTDVMAFAEELHNGQTRSDGQAHLDHLLRVTRHVIRWRTIYGPNPLRLFHNLARYGTKLDVGLFSATLLHDSVEDQSPQLAALFDAIPPGKAPRAYPTWVKTFSPEQIKALRYLSYRFGEEVARLVAGVTIVKPPERTTESRKEYNQRYYETVSKLIARRRRRLFLMKLADFYDNAVGLDTVQNNDKRVALAEKYLAVYGLFVKRLKNMHFLIEKHNRRLIIDVLENAQKTAQRIVAQEGNGNQV